MIIGHVEMTGRNLDNRTGWVTALLPPFATSLATLLSHKRIMNRRLVA